MNNNLYKSHLIFTSDPHINQRFHKGRGRDPEANNNEDEEDDRLRDYTLKKATLSRNLQIFNHDVEVRRRNRTIEVPRHIEYIKIQFQVIFNENLPKYFLETYGLRPVIYKDFNQSILFAIVNSHLFNQFISHLNTFIQSNDNVDPHGLDYSRIILIDTFEFLSSDKISSGFINEQIITLDLIDSAHIQQEFAFIYHSLKRYLDEREISYSEFQGSHSLDIKNLNPSITKEIVDNFDIISKVSSYRTGLIRPGLVGTPIREFDFTITPNPQAPLVGVIDTGVSILRPLRGIVEPNGYDLTGNDLPTIDSMNHGTAVAGLVILGEEFYKEQKATYQAKARVLPIKLIETDGDRISVNDLCNTIKRAYQEKGIRIFNLSVNDFAAKFYNACISDYAYALDKLAYENDLLIVISTGNLNFSDVEQMAQNEHPLHIYPNHFFNPDALSDHHACEGINICPPAESYNNLTVGALAYNLVEDAQSDLALDKLLPAYYTRKFHLNYSFKINGAFIRNNQINFKLFKPDLTFAGGDLLAETSQMQVLSNAGNFYQSSCGTSFSAPLVTSMIAQVVQQYPNLRMQTIKALIINSATPAIGTGSFLEELCTELKENAAQNQFNKTYDQLDRKEKLKVDRIEAEKLYKYIIGHGRPSQEISTMSNSNSVSFIIENTIRSDRHQVYLLRLPEYMKQLRGKFLVNATLCYNFEPVNNNHLAYCPLHISFGFFKVLEDLTKWGADKFKLKESQFKSNVTWSDDFSPLQTKPFTNTQKISFYLQTNDIANLSDQLSVLVRATHKTEGIEPAIKERLDHRNHPFSLVIRITELPASGEIATGLLYNELMLLNDMQVIQEADSDLGAVLDTSI